MMALATFQTKTEATLYTKTGQVTSIKVPAGTVLVCDWEWATGVLTGKRKIVEPAYYASYFVRSVDLTMYAPPTTDPTTDPNDIMVHYVNGVETERFQKVIS